jgi:hypothetical protein
MKRISPEEEKVCRRKVTRSENMSIIGVRFSSEWIDLCPPPLPLKRRNLTLL